MRIYVLEEKLTTRQVKRSKCRQRKCRVKSNRCGINFTIAGFQVYRQVFVGMQYQSAVDVETFKIINGVPVQSGIRVIAIRTAVINLHAELRITGTSRSRYISRYEAGCVA